MHVFPILHFQFPKTFHDQSGTEPKNPILTNTFSLQQDMFIILFSSCIQRAPSLQRLFGGRRGGYHRVGGNDDVRNGRGGRDREAENRLIDSYDEEWEN